MDLFTIISIVISSAALLSYVNYMYLKLPATIGVMCISICIGIALKIVDHYYPEAIAPVKNQFIAFDFSGFVLNIILCFLLFAGSLHVKFSEIKEARTTVFSFAIVGTLLSALLVAFLTKLVLSCFGYEIEFIICLLFGALISPTDPIAVIGILSNYKIPKKLKVEIIGESLFNDGVGVVLFTVIFTIFSDGIETLSFLKICKLLLAEVGGGLLIGFLIGYAGYLLMKSIDHYKTEILITLGVVMGGYSLAHVFHASGPLAMVVAGLIVGNIGKRDAMSDITAEYVDKFWELIDETCNIILFMLMGIEIFIVQFNLHTILIGLIIVVCVLFSRFSSLLPVFLIFNRHSRQKVLGLATLTWGGLRGGISIALALSLTNKIPNSDLFLLITYCVVFFSIIVQGLTISPLLRKFEA